MIKVLLVDDHELVRIGLKHIISAAQGMCVIAEAQTGKDAINLTREIHPHVTVMDGNLPGIGSIETTRRIIHIDPDSKLVILADYCDDVIASNFMDAGAVAYLTRTCSEAEFINTIRRANVGQRYIAGDIAQKLALKRPNERTPLYNLSVRERQILTMVTHGDSVQDISDALNLSTKTINSHRYRIFTKLNLNSDVELTHFAFRHGLLADLGLGLPATDNQQNENSD